MVVAYFEPGYGALGGALIGASAGILLLLGGEIMGASNLASTVILYPHKAMTDPGDAWRLFFIAIFMLLANTVLAQYFTTDTRLETDPSIHYVSTAGMLIGGFMVGFGTRLANGCTTGHGICGMARLSKRSFMAVGSFMFTAVGTANLIAVDNTACAKYTEFLRTDIEYSLFHRWLGLGVCAPIVLGALYALYNLRKAYVSIKDHIKTNDGTRESTEGKTERNEDLEEANNNGDEEEEGKAEALASMEIIPKYTETKKIPNRAERQMILDGVSKLRPAFLAGVGFATGLAVAGMTLPSKIMGFLNLFLIPQNTWDPTLIMVMGGGSIVSLISYQFVSGHGIIKWSYAMECPSRSSTFSIPEKKTIDIQLIVGSLCFGVGWGVSGLCPGPAIFLAASGCIPILAFWWPMFILGSFIAQAIKDRTSTSSSSSS
jgi:uncharacterized membrane protein YedE/YeeE